MPSYCCVTSCMSKVGNYNPEVSYHKFPLNDGILLKKWIAAVNREKGWTPSKWSSVCSKHFKDDAFKDSINIRKRCLKIHAIPTIFDHKLCGNIQTPNEQEEIHQTAKKLEKENNEPNANFNANEQILLEQTEDLDSDIEIEITEHFNRSNLNKTIEIDSDDEESFSVLIDHNYAEIKPTFINNFCRICAMYYEHNSILEYIFSNSNQILEKLSNCLPVIFLETDSLPHWICRKCILKLESYTNFIEMSRVSEIKLKDIFLNKHNVNINSQLTLNRNIKQETVIKEELINVEQTEERNQPKKNIIIHDVISIFPNVTKTEFVDFTENDMKPDVNNSLLNVKGPVTCDVHNCGLLFTDMNEFDAHIENNHLPLHNISKACIVLKQENNIDRRSICNRNINELNNSNNKKNSIVQYPNHKIENISPVQINQAHNSSNILLKQEKVIEKKSILESSSSSLNNSYGDENCDNLFVEEIIHENNIAVSPEQLNNVILKQEIIPENNFTSKTNNLNIIEENECNPMILCSDKAKPPNSNIDEVIMDDIPISKTIDLQATQINITSGERLYVCLICNKNFKDKFKLDEHCLIHTLRNKICINCRQTFKSLYDYAIHKQKCYIKRNVNKSYIFCDMCNQKFISKLALNNHRRYLCVISKGLSFKCNICRANFKFQYKLRLHMRQHRFNNLKNKEFRTTTKILKEDVSTECRKFNRKPNNNQIFLVAPHIQTNIPPIQTNHKYSCTICLRRYTKLSGLKRHKMQHKPYSEWQYECLKCSIRFEKIKDLRDHSIKCLMEEKNDNEKECEDIHLNNKPAWVCRICSKRLTTKAALADHERIHSGSKPFICDECGQQFRTVNTLTQHKFVHTSTSFPCQLCNKSFSRKSNLQVHIKTVHIKMKSYKCLICFKGFSQNVSLKNHYLRKHKTAKYVQS